MTPDELSNHYERAMVTFLDHNEFWRGATRFYLADMLPFPSRRAQFGHNWGVERALLDSLRLSKLFRSVKF